jgi:hypothetical protein
LNPIPKDFWQKLSKEEKMSGNSNVGNKGVYEAGDQRNLKGNEANSAERYNEGQQNAHIANDSSEKPKSRHSWLSAKTGLQRISDLSPIV